MGPLRQWGHYSFCTVLHKGHQDSKAQQEQWKTYCSEGYTSDSGKDPGSQKALIWSSILLINLYFINNELFMPSMGAEKTKFNFVECLFSKREIGVLFIFSLNQSVVISTWALWAHQAPLGCAGREPGARCLQLVCPWVQKAWKSRVTTHNRDIQLWHSSCQFWGPVQNCHSDSAGDSSDDFRHSDLHGPDARGQFSESHIDCPLLSLFCKSHINLLQCWWCETRMSVSHARCQCHLGCPLKGQAVGTTGRVITLQDLQVGPRTKTVLAGTYFQ